jgi:hypothetical protein
VDLVGAEGDEIGPRRHAREIRLSGRLYGVDVQQDPGAKRLQGSSDFLDRLDRADLVVRMLEADEEGGGVQQPEGVVAALSR